MAACVQAAGPAAVRGEGAPRPTGKSTRLAIGSTDDYEEICCLGAGGFGAVIKARHRATGQIVAIKRLAAAAGFGSSMALLREACLLQECGRDNPFVVGCYGLVRDPATMDLGLVMECVGPSLVALLLQHRLGRIPALPEAMVHAIMRQLLTGAKKMHDLHIIHRDIKPDNILIGNHDGSVFKFCDFGLAMSMAEAPPYDAVGTLWYMAPEMILGKPDYDAGVDTWSFGCVMAELIDGRALFEGSNGLDQLYAIFDVLGVPDETTWPWFSATPFASRLKTELKMKQRNLLRDKFPKTKLSNEGFEVLNGLLTCNPEKRLTAAAALKQPWFAMVDAL